MSRVRACKHPECARPVWWAERGDRKQRVLLDETELTRAEATADPDGVFYLDLDDGRAWPWTPMLPALDVDLFRAHRVTCRAPRAIPVPEPVRLLTPVDQDPQLRLPVLPQRFPRRPGAGHPTHERGNTHHGHHGYSAAA